MEGWREIYVCVRAAKRIFMILVIKILHGMRTQEGMEAWRLIKFLGDVEHRIIHVLKYSVYYSDADTRRLSPW